MRVGCWDCGCSNPIYERPRTSKSGMSNTVSVCKKCFYIWKKKHPDSDRELQPERKS